jgi:Tol biopolymer transport system component
MARDGVRVPAAAALVGILLGGGCGGGGGLPGTSGGNPSDTVSGRIAFDSRRSAGTDIWTVDANGKNLTRVTTLASAEIQPTWSPDGVTLAFASDYQGMPLIYQIPAAGGSPTPVTSKPAGNGDLQPAWSPDGQWIAFRRDLGIAGGGTIMKIHPDGSGLAVLIEGDSVGADGTKPVRNPAWSPSGTRLAFWRGTVDLCTVGIDGTGLHVVASVTGTGSISPS